MASDKTIACSDCSTPFTFTVSEQNFFKDKGFTDPKRCKPCRDKKKEQKGKGK